jgi:hypothetical protein
MIEMRVPVAEGLRGEIIGFDTRLQQLTIEDKQGTRYSLCFSSLDEDFVNINRKKIPDTFKVSRLDGKILKVAGGKFKIVR